MSKLTTFFKIMIEAKKINGVLQFNQLQWLKSYVKFNSQKKRSSKNGRISGKALWKLMTNAVNGKTIEIVRNGTDRRLASKRNWLFKMDIKTKLYLRKKFW